MEINNTSHSILAHNSLKSEKLENSNLSRKVNTGNKFTDKEKSEIAHLRKEDLRVRTHENAHKAAAGNLSNGGPNYDYKMGPDGKRYAVSGHVNIDTAEVPNDPEKSLEKAKIIKAAALAPTEPSPQDIKVARAAAQMEVKARRELAENKTEENTNSYINKVRSSYNPDLNRLTPQIDFSF